jgi:hypothetical protein
MKRLAILLALAGAVAQAATNYYVTVSGLGGEPDYEKRFAGLAQDLHKVFSSGGTSVVLSGAGATRAAMQAALDKVAKAAKADDVLVLTLIGHGTYDGAEYKFNLPGPDLTADELRSWLDRIAARQVVVVATSCSGATVDVLRRANRALVVATKSGTQKNATVFARYWVEALQDAGTDTDKNDMVSALEAFRYADQKTVRFYETNKRIPTEQALLEDTGKAAGVRNPGPDNGQGLFAGRVALLRTSAAQALYSDPAKRKLLERKSEVEAGIDQLKYEKAAMAQQEYRKQLQALLLELATIQEALDK